jgi:hypothetical protein
MPSAPLPTPLLLFAVLVAVAVSSAAAAPAPAAPPLVCSARADAVALVAAACPHFVYCAFEFGALAPAAWDIYLVEQTELLSPSATLVLPHDARRKNAPPALLTAPLLAFNAADAAAVDCAALATAVAADAGAVPAAVVALLAVLSQDQQYTGEEAQCADVNEVALYTNVTGVREVRCLCAPGKVCDAGAPVVATLLEVVGIITVVLAIALALYAVVSGAWQTRQKDQLDRRLDHLATRADSVELT